MIHRSLVTGLGSGAAGDDMVSDAHAVRVLNRGYRRACGRAWAVCEQQGGSGDVPDSELARRYRRIPFQITPSPETQIGSGQAWYYPADRTLVLWECFLNSFVRDRVLREDANMSALWQSFEDWLRRRFPDTRTIATPFTDPLFETAEYQALLGRLGFAPITKAAFGKML